MQARKDETEKEIEEACEKEDYDLAADLEEKLTVFLNETESQIEHIKSLLAQPECESSFATFMHVNKVKRGELALPDESTNVE